ncbi:MAG: hypothetical protein QF790_03600 [Gammaproteobacteria bacterium]|jgi:hypothetical protein|nr:hypothetical protein [Gammaproteobacteria bacterium]MDP6616235.1 hypothetical protein [Gammaproteobacteria bacterium]MDP6695997.1 hypothetical protein [Gammaproteobacteria bacterium]
MAKGYSIAADVHLPLPTAIWVLSAHLYAVLVPLVVILAVSHHWSALQELTAYPVLLLVAAGIMMAGGAFEVSQNAIDRWYLTAEAGSAEGTGFCDFIFYWFIVASQGLIAMAFMGDRWWVTVPAILITLVFPVFYFKQVAQFAPLGVLSVLGVVAAWLTLGDPVVFLQLLLAPLTMYFFGLLLKTGAQVLHGFTTSAASSGVLFLAAGIHGGASGEPLSWFVVGAAFVATIILAAILRPLLAALPATPRNAVTGQAS